ncbi:hypothetical protein PENSUB_658 [Penicillium subrubescens]|uniref:Uncharacterized protein n=1 Tax=Penicillium subrubescens TaxID=1316194 RepID=A0A1Q5ULW9_9EURO|nr:hypothetical protein PENSUB_658 [Penicillium subrubescens]
MFATRSTPSASGAYLQILELLLASSSYLICRANYTRQIWEIYQQLEPAEREFWDLLNEADSSDGSTLSTFEGYSDWV